MRFLIIAMCLFVSLIVISTSFYFFIVVNHYVNSKAFEKHKNLVQSVIGSIDKTTQSNLRAPFAKSNYDVIHETANPTIKISDKTQTLSNEVRKYKDHLVTELKRRELDASNVIFRPDRDLNVYKVKFEGKRGSHYASVDNLCRADFEFVDRRSKGFHDVELVDYLPVRSLAETLEKRVARSSITGSVNPVKRKKTCALVSSAGAMKGSNLGADIDSHEIVLRFNDAPTKSFEADVGSKTTIRIINSKVIASKKFNISNSLYKDNILIGWDPFEYVLGEPERPLNYDHSFFENYKQSRLDAPNTPFYLIAPRTIWKIYNVLQESSKVPMPKTPPSSGFLGLSLLVKFCSSISTYEYIPSIRVTKYCHYYDNSTSMGCTFGEWHPLATEKLFALRLNYATDFETVVNGKALISGCVN